MTCSTSAVCGRSGSAPTPRSGKAWRKNTASEAAFAWQPTAKIMLAITLERRHRKALKTEPLHPELTTLSLLARPSPPAAFACEPDCPTCGGVGYYRLNVPLDDPRFGKVYVCPTAKRLNLQRRKEQGSLDSRCGITPEELQNLGWTLVKKGTQAERAAQRLQTFCQRGYGMAVLLGSYGQGKTLLLKIAAVTALNEGKLAAYANLSEVLDDIRMAYDSPDAMHSLVERSEWWSQLDVLCLDEMDKLNVTAWAQERLFRLLDMRYTLAIRQQAVTVLAANFTSLEPFPGYLRSRLEDNRLREGILLLRGEDLRKRVEIGRRF